jgi:hypothetical protein
MGPAYLLLLLRKQKPREVWGSELGLGQGHSWWARGYRALASLLLSTLPSAAPWGSRHLAALEVMFSGSRALCRRQ